MQTRVFPITIAQKPVGKIATALIFEVIWDQAYTYWYNQLAGTDNMCSPSISAPHGGDGNFDSSTDPVK